MSRQTTLLADLASDLSRAVGRPVTTKEILAALVRHATDDAATRAAVADLVAEGDPLRRRRTDTDRRALLATQVTRAKAELQDAIRRAERGAARGISATQKARNLEAIVQARTNLAGFQEQLAAFDQEQT